MKDYLILKLWHNKRKEFVQEFSILQTLTSDGNIEHTYFERNPKTLELERISSAHIQEIRCTGLKDKNGKLIFEGDVCRAYYDACGEETFDVEIAAWSEKLCAFSFVNSETFNEMPVDDYFYSDDYEIFSNVFEEPKYLKKKKRGKKC